MGFEPARIHHKPSGAELRVLTFSPGSAHGIMGATLLLADEVAQWPKSERDRMWTAMESTLGKSPGCRLIAISTKPSDRDNPMSKMLAGSADYALEFSSRAGRGWDKDSAIRTANPALSHFPALKQAIDREREQARHDPQKLPPDPFEGSEPKPIITLSRSSSTESSVAVTVS